MYAQNWRNVRSPGGVYAQTWRNVRFCEECTNFGALSRFWVALGGSFSPLESNRHGKAGPRIRRSVPTRWPPASETNPVRIPGHKDWVWAGGGTPSAVEMPGAPDGMITRLKSRRLLVILDNTDARLLN
ncbi:hypothetical protein Bbelb_298900 [Branchiostoma belcheri]|nr:hypothetical protein Bbelb_298900 [Branchiostoma belcheri]